MYSNFAPKQDESSIIVAKVPTMEFHFLSSKYLWPTWLAISALIFYYFAKTMSVSWSARRSGNVASRYSETSGWERGMLIVPNALDAVLTFVAIVAYGDG